ncbi:MAG: Spi family protease inhibitor, partial [Bacteroidales bacterium]|nr:Spi family protease inhibitor [Bacteroidales bacterium]
MKKFLLAIVAMLLVGKAAVADPVDYARAKKVALTAARMHNIELANMSKIPSDTAVWWNALPLQPVGIEDIYLFNIFGYNHQFEVVSRGFVVVSGDDIASPILAFSTEDNLPYDDLKSVNPAAYDHLQTF